MGEQLGDGDGLSALVLGRVALEPTSQDRAEVGIELKLVGLDQLGAALLERGKFADAEPLLLALLRALDEWVTEGLAPPASRYPKISDGTLTAPEAAGWPTIPMVRFPPPMLITYRLDFGPEWRRGIVGFEPPHVGKPYVGLVPAVDPDGNARAGIRLPSIQVPIATYAGWNYRASIIGAADQFLGEAGSMYPFAPTRSGRSKGDSRLSLEERYASRDQYLGKIALAGRQLIAERLLPAEDLADVIDQAAAQYDWAIRR